MYIDFKLNCLYCYFINNIIETNINNQSICFQCLHYLNCSQNLNFQSTIKDYDIAFDFCYLCDKYKGVLDVPICLKHNFQVKN